MNFGQNILNFVLNQVQPIVMVVLAVMAVYILAKRETSKLLGFILLAAAVILVVFNVTGVKDWLLSIGNNLLS